MKNLVSSLLHAYENGRLTRRQLVQSVAALAAGASTASAKADSTFQGVEVNHVALQVTDVARSRDFYQKHLGLPVVSESASNCFLGMGRNFLALFKNAQPGMNHYCIAIEDYEVGKVTEELRVQGLNPRQPAGSRRVYFDDPDGIEVQLSASDHRP